MLNFPGIRIKLIGQQSFSKGTCSKLLIRIEGCESGCYKSTVKLVNTTRNNYVEKSLKLNEHSGMGPNLNLIK